MFDSVSSIITMVAVVAVFVFYFFVKKKEGKDWIYAVYFLTILITGVVLYSIGLYYKEDSDTTFSPLFVIARAITCSLKALSGDFQVATVSKLAKANSVYKVAIFVHFIAAMILTFLIAIKLFGKNAINKFRVFINTIRSKYIVIGARGQVEIFLKSLDYKKRKRTTVILEAKHKDKKKDLMFQGFAVVVIKDNQDAQLKKSGSGNKRDITKETYEALKTAGFDRTNNDTKIIAMSDDDEVNLLVAKIITDYITGVIKPAKNKKGRINKLSSEQEARLEAIKVSAHIMYESLDRTEHFAFAEYALGRVRFFNPYEIRSRKFMIENPITSLIPKEWINTEKARLYNASDDGHDKPYKIGSFFIGYGYTNQHILKKSVCNYQLLGTDYNALIIDKDARKLEKQFQNSAPGLFHETDKNGKIIFGSELRHNPDGSVYFPNPEESYNISFADLNVLSSDFYKRIINEIAGAGEGYDFVSVVIALGTDKLSIETALELRQKLYERKLLKGQAGNREYDRVKIFVKILKESVLSDYNLLNDKNDIDSEIIVFGASDEILNEDYIIHEKLDFIAKRLANDYWKIAGSDSQKTNMVSKWDSLTEFKRDSNRYAAMSIRTKLNLLGFELKEGIGETDQKTIELYGKVYGLAVSQQQRADKESGKFVDFAESDENGNILDNARNNLARLEHQRWNTLHLLSGWTKLAVAEVTADTRQDEKAKQHACITTFEGLSDLRQQQADEALKQAKQKGGTLTPDEAASEADTVCYDFDVMDRLFGNLKESNFSVYKHNAQQTK